MSHFEIKTLWGSKFRGEKVTDLGGLPKLPPFANTLCLPATATVMLSYVRALQEMGIISIASVFQSQFSKACVSHSYN